LTELVEAEYLDYTGQTVTRLYELYEGDWVQLYTHSGNAYWHTVQAWETHYPQVNPIDRRYLLVLSDGGYIGHWVDREAFDEFLRLYMRATITATLRKDNDDTATQEGG